MVAGYEIDLDLKPVILEKAGFRQAMTEEKDTVEVMERSDARRLRAFLQERVALQRSVVTATDSYETQV